MLNFWSRNDASTKTLLKTISASWVTTRLSGEKINPRIDPRIHKAIHTSKH